MKNNLVDDYIYKQKTPQKEICQKLRQIIVGTFPDIEEEMKWGVPTYGNGRYYIVALKDYVNMGFSVKGLTKDAYDSLDGSGKTMRHIKVSTVEDINEPRIVSLLKLIAKKQK